MGLQDMRCSVAIALLALTSLLAAGCGTQLDFLQNPGSDESRETNAASGHGDLSEGYSLAPASGGAVADHEKRRRAETLRPRPEAKPQDAIREPLPGASATDNALTPSVLVGLNFDQAKRLLGPPDMEENGQPSRIWQYADDDCHIRLHFYYDLKTRRYRLLRFEASPPTGETEDTQAYSDVPAHCLRAFRQRVVANGKP